MNERAQRIWTLVAVVLGFVILFPSCSDNKDIPSSASKPTIKAWVASTGRSMVPTFPESCLVEAEFGVAYDDLAAGNTVIFWDYTNGNRVLIHHRLVAKQGDNWIAQGDNKETNPKADKPWVTRDNYVARTTGQYALVLTAPRL